MSKIIGYTTGVFDLFHIGHLNILKNAKSLCDELIVGISTDDLCYDLKNKTPIIPYEERIKIIESIRFVDKVVKQEIINEIEDWNEYRFHRLFKGSDWRGSEKWLRLEEKFSQLDVEVVYFDYTENTSSTLIRKILEENSIKTK